MASKSGKPQQTIPKKGRNFLETGRASRSPPTPSARKGEDWADLPPPSRLAIAGREEEAWVHCARERERNGQ
ncbi:hypothetical protein GUJ93_ZPchr0013g35767 [Zizania palustris]|uniref:Uncharacterized protein n=1 Tax=Zizania palustris TaxID=103762 RepID=A0A8J6BVS7_ZIZPA|nr:hypothetical protein GUJ93_ZPchr0013g35767 [Zizania palustris]